jgi:ATP-dependent DNA helicase RecQ
MKRKENFGFEKFRVNQSRWQNFFGKDALAIMPTGGGKSICFQLPALLSGITIKYSIDCSNERSGDI